MVLHPSQSLYDDVCHVCLAMALDFVSTKYPLKLTSSYFGQVLTCYLESLSILLQR